MVHPLDVRIEKWSITVLFKNRQAQEKLGQPCVEYSKLDTQPELARLAVPFPAPTGAVTFGDDSPTPFGFAPAADEFVDAAGEGVNVGVGSAAIAEDDVGTAVGTKARIRLPDAPPRKKRFPFAAVQAAANDVRAQTLQGALSDAK
ncbi:hypothetical protein HK101_005478 [Irineochytrium annulatum]|nr:hypothetical protein HK101_005478 [Irineochytrium annulatum]